MTAAVPHAIDHADDPHDGEPPEWHCEGRTRNARAMRDTEDAAYLNAHGITFAIVANGPWEDVAAYRAFLGHTTPEGWPRHPSPRPVVQSRNGRGRVRPREGSAATPGPGAGGAPESGQSVRCVSR